MSSIPEDLQQERDLFRQLLELGQQSDVEALLPQALELVATLARALQGYLELRSPYADDVSWSTGYQLESGEVEVVRAALSNEVIRRSLTLGETVSTASALQDPRFRDRESVKRKKIEAILCIPIGQPPFGVIYLQGRRSPGPFSMEDRQRTELCGHQIAMLADRLILHRQRNTDHVAPLRQRFDLEAIIGTSQALARALEQLLLAAPLDVSVLITGATGTGKSHFARTLHQNSRRRGAAFVELNCAALPENLVESELFGAERGAHSTATQRVVGKVAAAEGGTLFLDEIGDLTLTAQAKLLQLLQEGTYYPLGAAQPSQADVRVVAATNRDLAALMQQNRFREDLFYRLQVLPVRVPSLEERRDDIATLARAWCQHVTARHQLPVVELTPGALQRLETASWPGNVRQLLHVVEAGAIRAAGRQMSQVEGKHLFPDQEPQELEDETFQGATRRFQRDLVSRTLEATGWNVKEAAERLDVARSYLYKLINSFGLERRNG